MTEPVPIPAIYLTEKLTKQYAKYISGIYGTTLHDKHDDQAMKAIGALLEKIGVLDADEFMSRFSTTLFKDVYLSFDPGVTTMVNEGLASRRRRSQVGIITHEHQHVAQMNETGALKFTTSYVADEEFRALAETEAYRATMEVHWIFTGQIIPAKSLANHLHSYMVSEPLIRMAELYLISASRMVESGNLVTEAALRTHGWFLDNERLALNSKAR